MDYSECVSLIKDVIDSLIRSNVISKNIEFSEDTVLIGTGSELDSLAFVALISDLEESLSDKMQKEVALSLTELEGFDIESPYISVKTLANFMVTEVD